MNVERAAVPSCSSIGEVLAELRTDFPDTTISKLRFLESEGLVEPERTAAGYRKYSDQDVARLRYVLTAQRDHYLPLKVIRDHLASIDQGVLPRVQTTPSGSETAMPRILRALEPLAELKGCANRASAKAAGAAAYEGRQGDENTGRGLSAHPLNRLDEPEAINPQAASKPAEDQSGLLTREQLVVLAGIDEELLGLLEQFGLLAADRDGSFAEHDVEIAQAAVGLAGYGIEPRHLRAFRGAADREVGLFKQVIAPLVRQSKRRDVSEVAEGGSDLARETATQLCALSVQLHTALTRSALRQIL